MRCSGPWLYVTEQRFREMSVKVGEVLTVALLIGLTVGACKHSSTAPAAPRNHSPMISSVTLFPSSIGVSDSAMVQLTASDVDGDTLVYDWIGDGKVRLKDAPRVGYIFSSPRNFQTFYYAGARAPLDTSWIQCYVRDQRGGQDGRLVALVIHS